MARTLDEWRDYVGSLIPGWHRGPIEDAVLYGIAKVFFDAEASITSLFNETFLQNAYDERLDQFGEERGIPRLSGESDAYYLPRITSRSVVNLAAIYVAIQNAITVVFPFSLPDISYATYEWESDNSFLDVSFTDLSALNSERGYNQFLIELRGIIPSTGRATFYQTLIDNVSDVNAFGVFFDIVYQG